MSGILEAAMKRGIKRLDYVEEEEESRGKSVEKNEEVKEDVETRDEEKNKEDKTKPPDCK